MKYIYIKILIGTFFLSMISCDDFLTTPPLDKIPDSEWWSDKQQISMMVAKAYSYTYGINEVALADCISDNATHRESNLKQVGNGTHTTHSGYVRSQWRYDAIANLNYILEGLEKSKDKLSEAEFKQYTAQVKFIRAFVYYHMLFNFGDIPLITKTLSVDEARQTSRQPRSEVLNFILNELENEVLPNIELIPVTESGRVNKQVVETFLARLSLYEGDYDNTIRYCNNVIGSGKYELFSSYDALFRPQSDETNKEVIFERQYASPLYVHELNRNLSYASSVYSGWSHVLPLQELVDEYECLNGHSVSECQERGCEFFQKRINAETETHRGEYDYRDPRLNATIIWPFKEWKVGNTVRSVFGVDDPNSKEYIVKETFMTGFLVTKWVDLEGEYADRTLGSKNMTILRYADVLLMKAEALIEKNQDLQIAVNLINEVRNRVNMPKIELANQEVLREKLRHERRIEFAFEDTRYNDIIRWKIGDKVKKGKVYGARMKAISEDMDHKYVEERFWNDKMYLLPIPQEAIDNNPNLTQNKGWE